MAIDRNGFPHGRPIRIDEFDYELLASGKLKLVFRGTLTFSSELVRIGCMAFLVLMFGLAFIFPLWATVFVGVVSTLGLIGLTSRSHITIDPIACCFTLAMLWFGIVLRRSVSKCSCNSRFATTTITYRRNTFDYLILTDGVEQHRLVVIRNKDDFAEIVRSMNDSLSQILQHASSTGLSIDSPVS